MRLLSDYEGRLLRLTHEREVHILTHPEMADMEPALEEALAGPDSVVESNSDPTVRLYYRRFLETPVGDKFLCVVVKVIEVDAFVITAYLTDKVKQGRILWERSR